MSFDATCASSTANRVGPFDEDCLIISDLLQTQDFSRACSVSGGVGIKRHLVLVSSTSVVAEKAILSDRADLRVFYERSGLTWREIAEIFGVSTRMLHNWVSGARDISEEQADIVAGLMRIIAHFRDLPAYKVRRFFRERVLHNSNQLESVRTHDFGVLSEIALEYASSRFAHTPIPRKQLIEQLPISPAEIFFDETEVHVVQEKKTKSKPANVGRTKRR